MAWMIASLSGLDEHRKATSIKSSSLDSILENMADDRIMNPDWCGAIPYHDTSTWELRPYCAHLTLSMARSLLSITGLAGNDTDF
jgi:hypothetical protein